MNENRKLIAKLIPYINSSNPIRRKGVINMIRNIMLDDFYWDKLVDNWDVDGYLRDIVFRVCANLNGNHIIEKKEVDPMITTLKKDRERDVEIIQVSLDLLLIITKYQAGRELLRKNNIYYVIRDMHMGNHLKEMWIVATEKILPENVVDVIGDLVTHLMADEEHPMKKEEPVVEEIHEETKESDSDSGYDDLPDLEWSL